MLHGKGFGFYPNGSGRLSKGLLGQVCIPQLLLQLLCRDFLGGDRDARTAIWKAMKPRWGDGEETHPKVRTDRTWNCDWLLGQFTFHLTSHQTS